MQALSTLLGLGPRRWLGVVQLASLALLVEAGLRIASLPRLAHLMKVQLALHGSGAPSGNLDQLPITQGEAELLDTAWRILRHRPFNGTCLRRALVGGYVLRRHDPWLRIGVAKSSEGVSAHAWVEVAGVSLDPDATLTYEVLRSPMESGRC
jgi:transglutaminase superfamily protein